MVNWRDYDTPFPAEPLAEYGDGELYPIYINDRFQDGRYEILNKLGFGGHSTVWAAQDHHKNVHVSIKAIKSKHSKDNQELRILQLLQNDKSQHPGLQYLPRLLDHFFVNEHLFLVLELLGPSLSAVSTVLPNRRFGLSSAAISKQLLLAVDCLHSHGVVHGDIHESNVLFRLPASYKLDLSNPVQGDVTRNDGTALEEGVPRYIVEPVEFKLDPKLSKTKLEEFNHIQLIDFSTSFFKSEPPETIHTVIPMSPPELIFRRPLGNGVDIWDLACTTFYLATGKGLFYATGDSRDLIPQMHKIIGEASAHWLLTALIDAIAEETWKDLDELHFDDYHDFHSLEEVLSDDHNIGESIGSETEMIQSKHLIRYLRKGLIADPSARATTKDLLLEEWVQGEKFTVAIV